MATSKIKKMLTQQQCQYLEAAGFDIPFDFTTVSDGRPLYDPLTIPDLVALLPEEIEFNGQTLYLNIDRRPTDDSDGPIWCAAYWTSGWDDNHWRNYACELIDALYMLVSCLRSRRII